MKNAVIVNAVRIPFDVRFKSRRDLLALVVLEERILKQGRCRRISPQIFTGSGRKLHVVKVDGVEAAAPEQNFQRLAAAGDFEEQIGLYRLYLGIPHPPVFFHVFNQIPDGALRRVIPLPALVLYHFVEHTVPLLPISWGGLLVMGVISEHHKNNTLVYYSA